MEILFAFTYSLCLCSKSPYERAVLICLFSFGTYTYFLLICIHTCIKRAWLIRKENCLRFVYKSPTYSCLQEPHLLALSQIPAKNMREKRPIKVHKKALCPYKENCHEIPGILQKRPIKEPFKKALRICEYTCRKFIFRKYVPDPLRSAYVKEKHQKSPFCMSTDLSRIPARICAGSVDGCRRTGFEPAGARTVIE